MNAVYSYEMGYTEAEFENTLTGDFSGESSVYNCTVTGSRQWCISHLDAPLDILISIKQSPARQLGAMSLPVLQVKFTVKDTAEPLVEEFFDKFFKYFHKGGG